MPPTAAGWTIMILSVGSVCALTAYCFIKVLTMPPREAEEHLQAPLLIDTRDTEDVD